MNIVRRHVRRARRPHQDAAPAADRVTSRRGLLRSLAVAAPLSVVLTPAATATEVTTVGDDVLDGGAP